MFILLCYVDASRAVRLVGGNSPSEGRVQVYSDGVWNGICEDDLNNRAATVVCRSLGLGFGVVDTQASYISARQTVNDVISLNCTGYESNLGHCQLSRKVDCNNVGSAGVICKLPGKYLFPKLILVTARARPRRET